MTLNPYSDGTDHEDAPACECGGALDESGVCEDCGFDASEVEDAEEAMADRRYEESLNYGWGL